MDIHVFLGEFRYRPTESQRNVIFSFQFAVVHFVFVINKVYREVSAGFRFVINEVHCRFSLVESPAAGTF